ncbi:CGNR zinc finger domain-containing protein [Bacillus sp. 31A1R]|uniref:CGNR zinc finger domain-containing protein n=1 Tax=Robertmurraya mangrovi TaxID=3098077 RepID=A0ABU5J1V7_9BACI|nr:CGNR zinc finger domain-containing protein [Bacillus sp. 31A1R]MDZ5473335.1 CGNR zinc finger domain-containing protein [Bacillus sp. 31A1R]
MEKNYYDLEIIADFFNTHDKRTRFEGDEGVEHLTSSKVLYSWLLKYHFIQEEDLVTDEDLIHAIKFRNEARKMIVNNDYNKTDDNLIEEINKLIDAFTFSIEFSLDSEKIIPHGEGGRRGIGRLILLIFELRKKALWHRIRVCSAEDCQWVFIDYSRPGTGKWCIMSACGNRAKNKTYREKIKHLKE